MQHVHFLGIGGSGASAIASIAQAQGFKISGCDLDIHSDYTKEFTENQFFTGHSPDHLDSVDILAVTPAIFSLDPKNPELLAAKEKNIPVMSWQEFMGKYLEEGKFVIAVCGTHGKSTTTALIGSLLEEGGLDPTVELGAILPKWGRNYRIGQGKYFLSEADEFNDNFLVSHPDITVVTSIEWDHPEYFKDFTAYKDSFEKFLGQTKKTIVANLADPEVAEVLKYVVKNTGIKVLDYTKSDYMLNLKIPGNYNILNAAAAFQVGLLLGITPEIIKKSLENFAGLGRRFEFLGEYKNNLVYSDYAHNPTKLRVALETVRKCFPDKKITAIFQPHMFTRTYALFDKFVEVLKNSPVDEILITDIFPSREIDTGLVNSKQLVGAVDKPNVEYVSQTNLQSSVFSLQSDILFFIGAGDIDKVAQSLIS